MRRSVLVLKLFIMLLRCSIALKDSLIGEGENKELTPKKSKELRLLGLKGGLRGGSEELKGEN